MRWYAGPRSGKFLLNSGRRTHKASQIIDAMLELFAKSFAMSFDKPTAADLQDPGRMWLDQLSGQRNFEPSTFMGFINDILERTDWQCLFLDLPNGAGFVAKLSDFFARHQGGLTSEKGAYLYFYPLERNSLEEARLVQLASEHVQELARLAGLAGAHDLRKRLSSLTTVWIDEHRDQGPMPQDASDLEIEISETIGDFLVLNEDIQTPWFSCLKEACYSVAADDDLQRYFMSDYYRIRFDYRAYYELWIGGGKLLFDDGSYLVAPVQRR